ncbi:MAG: Glycosyl transferase family 2 [Candidatus Roizmanbacteria bacterium GW2011_GWA2_35_19]|uniref:Glycosyl transferase family 2 n=2 Tax=Candidatus Roizmaniibacteriota TaxID=1752723 RepID=A0A0G0BSC2_9BACT|nr:MAG: Glycosyl transferase family 2 [Candidatus Roizmanbacteria bacterium GW2011_GWC2_35_12]KKP72293.1 MAG: Glycosyl transferase family 2 [Candidatus Roizmanbacteria bacterium GW2011_GWA2_35_19]
MKISLIIPCYNEQSNIQKGVLDKIGNYTQNNPSFFEVVIVDDGSSDDSKKIIKTKYLKNFPKFRLIENNHQGKAFAVITGIEKAKGEYAMFSDIDLATPIEEAEKLILEAKKGGQVVIGSRSSYRQGAPILRKIMAKGFIIVRNIVIGLHGIRDTQCGFKLFEKKAALRIINKLKVFHDKRVAEGSSVSAGFDLEFIFLAKRLGFKIKEVPVAWRHVETKNVNFINDSMETLKDIIKIKYYYLTGKYEV